MADLGSLRLVRLPGPAAATRVESAAGHLREALISVPDDMSPVLICAEIILTLT